MNDIINWIALNNTLMIRIGFTAVILLLVVYAFRFFFMPSISVVSSDSSESTAGSKDTQNMNIEELAELQGEIDTLKAKLKELQSAEQMSPEASSAAPTSVGETSTAGGMETVSVEPPNPSANESASAELKEKIKSLEARLSEYEIIAEEIAEIGKLRLENHKLKEMLSSAPAANPEPEAVRGSPDESDDSSTSVSDSEIDSLLGSVDENTAADAANPLAAEQDAEAALGSVSVDTDENIEAKENAELLPEKELFIIQSEVEVTEEEKELINSFEDFKKV